MRFAQRAWANLRQRKLQTIGLVLIFTTLFTITLICLMVYHTIDKTVEITQKAVGNAVTIQPPVVIGADLMTTATKLNETDIPKIIDQNYIEEYNTVVQYQEFFEPGEVPVLQMEMQQTTLAEEDSISDDKLTVTAIQNSEYYEPFSSGGFYLKEGTHFTSKDDTLKGILISSTYADENHLKAGDILKLHTSSYYSKNVLEESTNKAWDFQIRGVFTSDNEERLEQVSRTIYMPYDTFIAYWQDAYNGQSRISVHEINKVIVYLKSSSCIDQYIEYLQGATRVEQIADVAEGISYHNMSEVNEGMFNTTDPAELTEAYTETLLGLFQFQQWFYVLLDRGWYTMVAGPLEGIRNIIECIGIVLEIATFIILLLACSFTLRKRKQEFGVLISIGEAKYKILLQILTESLVMVAIAAVIGAVVAPAVTKAYGNKLISTQAKYVDLQYEGERDEYEKKVFGNSLMYSKGYNDKTDDSSTLSSTANVNAISHLEFVIDGKSVLWYFILTFAVIILSMMVQVIYILRQSPAELLRK
ncbi:MAG: ABC transporter permease [bacterium]|nr:ABC transporter permease [bacterium]